MADQYSALTDVISSVAAEETAAANIIKEEAAKLQKAIEKNASPAKLKEVNDSIARMMDELSKNNAELAKKMNTATSAPTDSNNPPSPTEQTNRQQALNDVIESVANEESAMADLMNAEAAKIKSVVNNPASSVDDMIAINDSASGMVDKVANTNTALAKKLDKAVNPTATPTPAP